MGHRALEIGAAMIVGAVVVLAAAALWSDRPESTTATTSTFPTAEVVSTDEFVDTWAAARGADVAIEGTQERYRGDELIGSLPVRQARRRDRSLDQRGDSALVVVDGTRRSCERLVDGGFGCAGPERAPSVAQETESIRARIEGNQPGYVVYRAEDEGCYLLVANEAAPGATWGQRTTMCFDQATGALAFEETVTGDQRDVFRAADIRTEVIDADLDPA